MYDRGVSPNTQSIWNCGHQEFVLQDEIDGVPLNQWMHDQKITFESKRWRKMCHKILEKVKKMHKLGLVHNDLHQENILVDKNDEPWLIDFNSSAFIKEYKALKARKLQLRDLNLVVDPSLGHPEILSLGKACNEWRKYAEQLQLQPK